MYARACLLPCNHNVNCVQQINIISYVFQNKQKNTPSTTNKFHIVYLKKHSIFKPKPKNKSSKLVGRTTTKKEQRSANTLYQELSFQDNEESEDNEIVTGTYRSCRFHVARKYKFQLFCCPLTKLNFRMLLLCIFEGDRDDLINIIFCFMWIIPCLTMRKKKFNNTPDLCNKFWNHVLKTI